MQKNQPASIRKDAPFEPFPAEASKIILDVDTGCDDAQCIVLLGYLAQKFKKRVIGITCSKGNTTLENVITNTLISVKQTGLKIKIYAGTSKNMMDYVSSDDWFGKDGLNNAQEKYKAQLTPEDWELVDKDTSAYEFITKSARKHGKDLIIACAAPLTNLAISYLLDNELPKLIAGVSIMGGSYTGMGLNEAFSAEFNFHGDAEAAAIVFKQFDNLVLLPLETAFEYPKDDFDKFFGTTTTAKGQFFTDIYKGMPTLLCDPLILIPIFFPKYVTKVHKVHAEVVTEGKRTRGFLACNWIPTPLTENLKPNVQIMTGLDYACVSQVVLDVIASVNK
jgi:inosine-uridine nucleoside N-ribohydrolase